MRPTEEVTLTEGIGHSPGKVARNWIVIGQDRPIVAEELGTLIVPEDSLQINGTASPVAIPISMLSIAVAKREEHTKSYRQSRKC